MGTERDASAAGGTYTLVVELAESAAVEVGALGTRAFPAGWYAYTGSAFGPGGFARVERHRELAAGERDARHWHVDYLLGHPAAAVETAVTTPGADVECAVARRIASESTPRGDVEGDRDPVAGFGASDCDCESHLAYAPDRADLLWTVERAHERAVDDTDERAAADADERAAMDADADESPCRRRGRPREATGEGDPDK